MAFREALRRTELRTLREALGLRLQDLSDRTGYDLSYLAKLETGARPLTLSVAAKLLEALRQGSPVELIK